MKTDNIIDEYIAREKGVEPSAYLESCIMAKIRSEEEAQTRLFPAVRILKGAAVAASFAAVVGLGVLAGSSYATGTQDYKGLMVNDSAIERFSIYTSDENE